MIGLVEKKGVAWITPEDCGCYPPHEEDSEECNCIRLDFEKGTLDELIAAFNNVRVKLMNKHPEFVDFKVYFDEMCLMADGMRPETHEERNKRFEKAQKTLEKKRKNLEKKMAEIAALEEELEHHE